MDTKELKERVKVLTDDLTSGAILRKEVNRLILDQDTQRIVQEVNNIREQMGLHLYSTPKA